MTTLIEAPPALACTGTNNPPRKSAGQTYPARIDNEKGRSEEMERDENIIPGLILD